MAEDFSMPESKITDPKIMERFDRARNWLKEKEALAETPRCVLLIDGQTTTLCKGIRIRFPRSSPAVVACVTYVSRFLSRGCPFLV